MANTPTTIIPNALLKPPRVPDRARTAALALAVLLLELVVARGAASPGISRFILLFLGVLALAFVFRFPLVTALLFLGFTDFAFHSTFFNYEVGSLSVRPHELALAALLLVSLIRPRQRSWGGRTGLALAGFLAVITVSGGVALIEGRAPLTDVFNWGRSFAPLALFWIVVRLFPDAEARRDLLTGGAVIAALAGVVAFLVALGWSFGDELKGSGTQIVREEEGLPGLLRVRLAGLSLGYGIFWYVAVRALGAKRGKALLWGSLVAAIVVAIAVSFNRNMWIGLACGLALMLLLGGPLVRARLALALGVGVTALVLIASLGSTTESEVLDPVIKRGATLLKPSQISQESSLTDRERETKFAWPTAQENLLLGVGPGAPFGVNNLEFVGPHSIKVEPQLFLHNQYLYLLLIGGIPGLVLFLLFLGVPVFRSFARTPRDPAILACGVGVTMIMLSSVVAIYFSVEDMTAVLGMLTGVIIADHENRAAIGLESGLA